MTLEAVQIAVTEVDGEVAAVGKEVEEVKEAEEDVKVTVEVFMKASE